MSERDENKNRDQHTQKKDFFFFFEKKKILISIPTLKQIIKQGQT